MLIPMLMAMLMAVLICLVDGVYAARALGGRPRRFGPRSSAGRPKQTAEINARTETVAKKPASFGCFQHSVSPPLELANIFVANESVGMLCCGQSWEPMDLEVR